jgi:nicotinate dehydrogenase subunit B
MAELSASLQRNSALDRWLRVDSDGTITIRTGKVELGQGILTALVIIAAEELDVDPSRIRIEPAITGVSPNEMITAGSRSVEDSGGSLRQACAHARRIMLRAAAEQLGTAADQLNVDDGTIGFGGGNRTVTYWALQGGRPFDHDVTEPIAEKPHAEYRWIGRGITRIDLPGKIRGEPAFVHDLRADGMLHARVVRPPGYHYRLQALDSKPLDGDPALVKLVVDGSFIAVVAVDEASALRLAGQVERLARWERQRPLAAGDMRQYLIEHETAAFPLERGVPTDSPVPDPVRPPGTRTFEAEYFRPYTMHASLAPSAAMALWQQNRLTVWSHSQGIEILRGCLAKALTLEPPQITVMHVQGAGAYGHNGADDVALDAALCARVLPGRPVLLKWTRAQEHQWEPYGPAARFKLEAALDQAGRIQAWSHDVWSFSHSGRPMPMREGLDMIAAWHLAPPFPRSTPSPSLGREVGIHRNAWPIYNVPQPRVVKHFVRDSPLRTSSLRGLGAHANVFAIESFMDELADAAGQDPAAFRLRHLEDIRAIAVIEKVVDIAGGGLGRQTGPTGETARGRGLGFARYKNMQTYAAVIAEVDVDMTSAAIRTTRLWIAADAGRVVDPDGLANQLEGGAVQSLSWTLKEAVQFDADGVTSVDWATYPILRFSEVPDVTTTLIDRPERRSLGAGEATQGPAAGALVNALYAATGLRVRDLPLTPERVRAAAAT